MSSVTTEPADVSEQSPASSPGAMLADARERQNLSVAEVARQLRLAPRQIEALEADDFASLPGPTFVRGFIRGYAKLVQADAGPILDALRAVMPEQPSGSPQPRPLGTPLPEEGAGVSRKRAVMGLLLLVLIPLALFEVFRQSQQATMPGITEPLPTVAVPESPRSEPGPTVGEQVPPPAPPETASAVSPPDQAAGQASVAPAPEAAEGPAPAPAAPAAEPAGPATPASPAPATIGPEDAVLRFRFAGESWVEVRDRSGQRVFSKVNLPGTEQTVIAEPPVTLIVGNASEVRLSFNDKPVDLAPHTRVNVARFTLE